MLLADGRVIADGPAAELLAGGWYFATETARILGGAGGALLPEQGAELLRVARRRRPRRHARSAVAWRSRRELAACVLRARRRSCCALGWLAYERARPSARMVAVVGTLAAVAALGRDAFVALPDVKPITAITLVVGYALGPLPGFTVGALGMLASNIVLGQGPYTPWQMAAWGSSAWPAPRSAGSAGGVSAVPAGARLRAGRAGGEGDHERVHMDSARATRPPRSCLVAGAGAAFDVTDSSRASSSASRSAPSWRGCWRACVRAWTSTGSPPDHLVQRPSRQVAPSASAASGALAIALALCASPAPRATCSRRAARAPSARASPAARSARTPRRCRPSSPTWPPPRTPTAASAPRAGRPAASCTPPGRRSGSRPPGAIPRAAPGRALGA